MRDPMSSHAWPIPGVELQAQAAPHRRHIDGKKMTCLKNSNSANI